MHPAEAAHGDLGMITAQDVVVDAYRADPLVHDRISARLAHFIDSAGAAVLKRAPRWKGAAPASPRCCCRSSTSRC